MQRLIFPLPGNEGFATRLAALCQAELGVVETRRFPDGESYVRLHGDPRGRPVDIVCTLARPDPGFLSLVYAADAARALGATQVNLVAPYLAYMRQDKRFQPGESVSSLSFARLVSSTFDRLLTVDPHLHRHPTLSAIYSIPTATLHAAPRLAAWIAANVPDALVVGPDEESEQWAASIATRIGAPYVVLRKIRHGDRQVDIEAPDLTRWRDRTPVLVDDIASSGRTLVAAAAKLAGMKPPQCVVVHALFAEDAWTRVSACFERVVSTDAVPHCSNRIELAPLLADALLRDLRD